MDDLQKHWKKQEQIRVFIVSILTLVALVLIVHELSLIVQALNICKI